MTPARGPLNADASAKHCVDAEPQDPLHRPNTAGWVCASILTTSYVGYLLMAAFAPAVLHRPVLPGGLMTWAFAAGFAIIGLGIFLTAFYALTANIRDKRQ
jgi:uncharacterized membrane protein (DUF485 family)